MQRFNGSAIPWVMFAVALTAEIVLVIWLWPTLHRLH
jgi:hypothetical protein